MRATFYTAPELLVTRKTLWSNWKGAGFIVLTLNLHWGS